MQQNVAHKSTARRESTGVSSLASFNYKSNAIASCFLPEADAERGRWCGDYTPPMAKHLQLLRLHAERQRQRQLLEQASSMKVFPSFSGSLNAAKTNVERVRKSQRKRERGGRQDRQTTKQKAARCCSCDKFVSLYLTRPTWRMRNVAAWHTNCD